MISPHPTPIFSSDWRKKTCPSMTERRNSLKILYHFLLANNSLAYTENLLHY